jgi:glycosyltransferase involved in cell wall biosynthesis
VPAPKFAGEVLHILAPGPVGGLESVVRALAAGQAARGTRVGVLAILDTGAREPAFLTSLREAGVVVHARPIPPRQYGLERAAVRAVCEAAGPAVVHTHGYRADVLAGSVARSLGLPTATTVHGFTGGDLKNRLYEWLQRRSFRRFGAVVAVSKPLVERLARAGVSRRRIHLVRNAWSAPAPALSRAEARARLGIADDAFRIGWVGRFTREKGPDLIVDALARLGDRRVRVSMIGDGRERAALVAQAASLGVADRIDWHGTVPDASRLFAAFDCFVLSSRTEGTPMVLFEAMATKTPIVAASVGGVPDVLDGGEALLVPAEQPASLAEAIGRVHDDRPSAQSRAAQAEARLHTTFGLEPWLERYDAIYSALAGAGLPPRTS